ncbi:MAG: SAM-dependent DNA methyltransferase [Verrucomicrobia bacterium]|nr:SAM-dependent DNA methyltransferase [Verrucomicrobiota bacterium]
MSRSAPKRIRLSGWLETLAQAPRDAVRLIASLIFLPIADRIQSGSYLLYDCACGTGGVLTVAKGTLRELATACGHQIPPHLYGQEINPETYAICKADMLLKGEA